MVRVVSSFSCSVLEAQAIDNATRRVKNRSAWIVDACLRKANPDNVMTITELSTIRILSELRARTDLNDEQRGIIKYWMDTWSRD